MITTDDYKTVKEVKELVATLPDDSEVIFRKVSPEMSSLRKAVNMLQTDAELDAEAERELEAARNV